MNIIKNVWRKITQTNALAQSSGDFEMLFFESMYRATYTAGLSTDDHSVLYLIYSSIVKMLIAMLVFGEVWFVYSEYHRLELDDIAACVNTLGMQMITIYKFKNMVNHKHIHRRLASAMESPYFDTSTNERKKLVKHWADTNERYLKLLFGLGNCTLAIWLLYPLVDELEYNVMVAIRLPFNYNTPQLYPFAYFLVGIAFIYIAHFVMVIDLNMQVQMVPLVCQLNVLSDCFVNIIEDCKEGITDSMNDLTKNKIFTAKYLKRLGNLVEQHKHVLTCTMDLRAILSGPLLGQLGASGTLICFIGYQATTSIVENLPKCLMSLFYLGYNMFGFYIICRWCEEITVKGQSIGEAAYRSGWETGLSTLPGVRSTIVLVIARANKPLVFTAGGMYNLSLQAYTNLVKTSYSALTVLLRFRHD